MAHDQHIPTRDTLVDAAENVVIAYGMGWEMDGVIARLREALEQEAAHAE